ncbi:hypothetical protein RE474_06825 [Methanolobus sediminis]|uniref:Uncharacterized protein n=1 Tax=Methanolobus sediminis TaxID=3072978 RepID=A0AA51UKU5_9EURY|nr:hypothetical protein [Methanolobus sediminis]WMW23825.1 hypothetical protein RE474_06825 [Methanolobus sediminis]
MYDEAAGMLTDNELEVVTVDSLIADDKRSFNFSILSIVSINNRFKNFLKYELFNTFYQSKLSPNPTNKIL